VAFIDLAGFTTLTHDFDPEELRDLADEILTVIAGIVEDYDGYVDAFTGDGLIALFGAPRSHPDDPERAVSAAAAGLEAIERIGQNSGHHLRGRAGVNTGIVIAGPVGSGRVQDYTVMGSAVNLAARLEAAAAPGEVWVGSETYEATRHALLYTPSPPVELRGFPDLTQAYRLVGAEQRDFDPYAALHFVGRRAEWEALERTYTEVQESGALREVWLAGEAGSGKTRLMREFVASLGEHALLLGEADETRLWVQLMQQLSGDPEGSWQKLERYLDSFDLNPRQQDVILASLGVLELPGRERPDGDEVVWAWSSLLAAVAARRLEQGEALALFLDGGSRSAAFERLSQGLHRAGAALLLVRPSRAPKAENAITNVITLAPLSMAESLEILAQVVNPILDVATRSLAAQAGGVPAYVLELGRALGSTPGGAFSGSLTSLLQARLDMLKPGARQLLAYAALCGERSWEGLLTHLEPTAQGALRELLDDKLLVQESSSQIPGELEFRFQSELLRRAVLRMIPFGERPALHLRIAGWLEQHAPLDLSQQIGQHFEQARAAEAAYPHYLTAAELAGQKEGGFALYEKLLSLELVSPLKAEGALAYAQAALDKKEYDLALKQLEAAGQWIGADSTGERSEGLRRTYEQLRREVVAAQGIAQISNER
jgi:class 3 adenylate cyclase